MTQGEILEALEKALNYRLEYAGVEVVPAAQIKGIIDRIKNDIIKDAAEQYRDLLDRLKDS